MLFHYRAALCDQSQQKGPDQGGQCGPREDLNRNEDQNVPFGFGFDLLISEPLRKINWKARKIKITFEWRPVDFTFELSLDNKSPIDF